MSDFTISQIAEMADISTNECRAYMRAFLRKNGIQVGNLGGRISAHGAELVLDYIAQKKAPSLPATTAALESLRNVYGRRYHR